jgi:hypothetical protein
VHLPSEAGRDDGLTVDENLTGPAPGLVGDVRAVVAGDGPTDGSTS